MEQAAIFVDAGYLLASGGIQYLGTAFRSNISCDFSKFIPDIIQQVEQHSCLPVLRVYYYDAAQDAVMSREQKEVASIPRVKVRMGNLIAGRQKGVDSLIILDLIKLATLRAISTVYLLTGDEDIREGVAEAQSYGLRINLLTVPGQEAKVAQKLIYESDDQLPIAGLERFFRHANGAASSVTGVVSDPLYVLARNAGMVFARTWLERATPEDVKSVTDLTTWMVPQEIDRQLLIALSQEFDFRTNPDLRIPVRQGFKDEVLKSVASIQVAK